MTWLTHLQERMAVSRNWGPDPKHMLVGVSPLRRRGEVQGYMWTCRCRSYGVEETEQAARREFKTHLRSVKK